MKLSEKKKNIDKKDLIIRTIAGGVCLGLFILTGNLGGWFFFGFTAILSVLGLWEFYSCISIERSYSGLIGLVTCIAMLVLTALKLTVYRMPALVIAFILQMAYYVLDYERVNAKKAMAAFFGLFYVAILFSCLYDMREMADGKYLVFLTLIAAWGSDTFAYLAGSLFGRRKLSPVLSPKKSVEGVIGGFAGAVILGLVFALIFKSKFTEISHPVIASIVITAFGSIASVFGDLTASAFKRDNTVKDYSHLIPGHGGILDRFDSILFVAPVVYYLAKVFTL